MKRLVFLVGVLVFVVTLSSCGGKLAKNGVKITVVETIPNVSTPKWVENTNEFYEEKGNYFYRGVSEGMTNLQAARRAASASAITSLAEQVKSVVRNEFASALEGNAYDVNTGGYLKDVFFSVVDNLSVSGVVIKETYVQRLQEISDTSDRTYYRSYALAQVSIEDYKKMVKAAFDKTSAQVQANKSAKELVKETEARFWEQEKLNENN